MREFGKLTALAVRNATKRGMLNDGGGLYLRTAKGGSRSWILRYKVAKREHHFGLGSLRDVTLSMARDKAREARRALLDGRDPISARKAAKAASRSAKSFRQVADEYIAGHAKSWSARTAEQWRVHLTTYILPIIGNDCPVADVDTAMVLKVLTPLWAEKTETANRVRRRIESILDAAKVMGLRSSGENPARWRGHLDKMLPKQSDIAPAAHHEAMDWKAIPDFLTELRRRPEIAARALEFAILCAVRTGEVQTFEWADLDGAKWVIPSTKTKSRKPHTVPLSDRAVEIIEEMKAHGLSTRFVFPGARSDKPVARGALLKALRMIDKDVTTHGFRASFRTWATDTGVAAELAEMALGHVVGDKVERAYQRGDMFARRRALMEAWAAYCAEPVEDSKVKKLRA